MFLQKKKSSSSRIPVHYDGVHDVVCAYVQVSAWEVQAGRVVRGTSAHVAEAASVQALRATSRTTINYQLPLLPLLGYSRTLHISENHIVLINYRENKYFILECCMNRYRIFFFLKNRGKRTNVCRRTWQGRCQPLGLGRGRRRGVRV